MTIGPDATEQGALAAAAAPPIGPRGSLVVARRPGQRLLIGDVVEIEVVEARSGLSRLRVTAPKEIRIDRLEVREAQQEGAG